MRRALAFACLLLVCAGLYAGSGGASPAHAADPPSVAVLPLEKAAASAQYDGLGRALAGMVVSDLSALPGLRLVERDQLEALLAEMKLQETGFLDPKTAQKLGKGVGARYVVAGSFTVLEPAFALDARIVEVQTGEIVKAASASGTVADFVAVEKELVEALVAGLDLTLTSSDRRKLLMQAPTERFTAFTAYGEGLARKSEGKLDEAKTAFARALSEDPQFADAQAALGDLEALVKRREAERTGAKRTARDEAFAGILASVPDIRTLPATHTFDQAGFAQYALRLAVLEEQGRDCDRYAEMRTYLDRVGWKVAEPPRKPTDEGVLGWAILQAAKARGLDQPNLDPNVPKHLKSDLPGRADVFRDTANFVFNGHSIYQRSHGLLSSLLACYAPREALRELDGLIAGARTVGLAGTVLGRSELPITLEDTLQVWWLRTRAGSLGADAELTKRTEALLAAYDKDPTKATVIQQVVDGVLDQARYWEEHQVRRRGLPTDEIVRRMRLVAEGKLAATTVCKQAVNTRATAVTWVAEYDRKRTLPDMGNVIDRNLDDALQTWAPAADFGCLEGVSPRFSTPAAAWTWFDGARARAVTGKGDATQCAQSWVQYEQMLESTRAQRQDANVGPVWLYAIDQMWTGLVYHRCAHE
ncbi:MAG: CsgG/HfaB family protein [Pseudomonadota bacterium]|nr:CsgG/HfaB family protein [Pseudomonadota bacterium]